MKVLVADPLAKEGMEQLKAKAEVDVKLGLKPEELWVLYRNKDGYTQAKQTSKMKGIKDFINQGALLGHLWMEGHFEVGDPLTASGGPK